MPADINALTRLDLKNAVLGRRFPAASQGTNALRWLAAAYTDVWAAADWTFKRVSRATLNVTSGVAAPTLPADYGTSIGVWDQFGDELVRLSQERFEHEFAEDLALSITGQPWAYTTVNRQVILGPTPNVTGTFRHSYMRRLSHRESDFATVTAGFMDEDNDYPLWDDHHGVLIPRATAIGLLELNDPTWQQQQDEYERQLARMNDDYEQRRVADRSYGGAAQWGRN